MKLKFNFKPSFLVAVVALFVAACAPKMDAPASGSIKDPTRPNAPPQVIAVPNIPAGMEISELAISGDHLYATVPDQDQVYRIHIADLQNLALTGNPVPYLRVPGAGGIAADDRCGLYIGSTGEPKEGRTEHKWTNDQVIYFHHTSESWSTRFKNEPAQKLFVAPRGSFDALAWYKDPTVANNKRYEGGLYYAGGYNLEGMGINNKRYTNSLNAVTNLVPDELNFLIELALGGISFDDLDLAEIFKLKETIKVALKLDPYDRYFNADGSINYLNLALDNLTSFVTPALEGPGITFNVKFKITDITTAITDKYGFWSTEGLLTTAISLGLRAWNGGDNVTLGIKMSPLYLKPEWGLHLATLWSPVVLEIEKAQVMDLLYEAIGGANGAGLELMIKEYITDALLGVSDASWFAPISYAVGALAGSIAANSVADEANITALLSNYLTPDGKISLNGNYVDQPGPYPPRPYLLPNLSNNPSEWGKSPWEWNISNLSALSPRPNFLGYPMSINFADEVENGANLKIALTLYLLQFENGSSTFSLLGEEGFDNFVNALSTGSMLDKITNIVDALHLEDIKNAINNPQLIAYINFLFDVVETSKTSDLDIMATLSGLGELFKEWGVSISFEQLLKEWWNLPDWADLDGTKAGWIIDHDMLGSIYGAIDGFTEGLTGIWETLAGWVTSKIPRVNSAQGWWYESPVKPTGIAFGRDLQAGVVGWVVDEGKLYSRSISAGAFGNPSLTRDDYPWRNADGSEPYVLDGISYYRPNYIGAGYAFGNANWKQGERYRWTLTVPGSGQTKTIVPSSMVLSNCHGVVYDPVSKRVLVSCNDAGSKNKGRIVSVKYDGAGVTTYGPYYYLPPPPRIQIKDLTYTQINTSFEVHELIPADGELNHPKGMAIKDNYLFIADGNRIVVYYMGHK